MLRDRQIDREIFEYPKLLSELKILFKSKFNSISNQMKSIQYFVAPGQRRSLSSFNKEFSKWTKEIENIFEMIQSTEKTLILKLQKGSFKITKIHLKIPFRD